MDEQNLKKARSNLIVLIEALSQQGDTETARLVWELIQNVKGIDELLVKR